jgi:Na+-driven multidrug efflux pump
MMMHNSVSLFHALYSISSQWAYATAKATRIGANHVAAHQVALSLWLVFALILDGVAVAAQVLMTRSVGQLKKVRSLLSYMGRVASIQGLVTTGILLAAAPILPKLFTSDAIIGGHLQSLMPTLAWQQLLVSMTLVAESLAVGGKQFQLLAVGTTISTIFCMEQLREATSVVGIWSRGIVALFVGRLVTSIFALWRVLRENRDKKES